MSAVSGSRASLLRAGLSGLVISAVTARQKDPSLTCLSPRFSASAACLDPKPILSRPFSASFDTTMSSDDDLQPAVVDGANGNRYVAVNGNGHFNGDTDDSPMSEDDMPLVCVPPVHICYDPPITSLQSQANSIQAPSKSRRRKRAAVQDSDSEDDDDIPLASSPAKKTKSAVGHRGSHATTTTNASNGKAESDSDAALATVKRKCAPNGKVKAPPKKKVKKEEERSEAMEASASDDEPLTNKGSSGKAKVKPESDVEMKDIKPKRKRGPNKKAKEEDPSSQTPQGKKKGKKKEEEDAEEVYRWWEEQANGDGEEKWQTLEHNGVIFPPPYERLPSHVKMNYKGPDPVVS